MHTKYEHALNVIADLDSWDIQATLGAVNYLCLQSAINTAVRMLPALPEEGSGVEGYTSWEQKMQEPAIKEAVAPLIGYAERTQDVLNQYTTTEPFDYQHVLEFMTSRLPVKETFVTEYNTRKRLGMRPDLPMAKFVEMEYAVALQRHANLVAKGEAAVHMLSQIEGNDASAPEWFVEAVDAKVLQKLEQRWERAEMRRTNPRITKEQRDLAAANQELIVKAIEALGGHKPSFAKEIAAEDDFEQAVARSEKFMSAQDAAREAATTVVRSTKPQ